jgi:predicted site-specific integrase-resolvase
MKIRLHPHRERVVAIYAQITAKQGNDEISDLLAQLLVGAVLTKQSIYNQVLRNVSTSLEVNQVSFKDFLAWLKDPSVNQLIPTVLRPVPLFPI